jgi:hypothetical protein
MPDRYRMTQFAHRSYLAASGLIGIATFLACISFTVGHFGLFHGLAIGWLPSIFFGAVASYLWPVVGFGALVAFAVG